MRSLMWHMENFWLVRNLRGNTVRFMWRNRVAVWWG